MLTQPQKIYIETYGCQMNVADTEVIFSILGKEGYERTEEMGEADVIMANTCSVRDNAVNLENRIRARMRIPLRYRYGERLPASSLENPWQKKSVIK